jgi:hypothetical protein
MPGASESGQPNEWVPRLIGLRPASLLLWVVNLGFGHIACAQESASFALVSDHVYRGRTLSDGHPSAMAGLEYDAAGGWYGGISAATARLPGRDRWEIRAMPYAGFARQIAPGITCEAGVSVSRYTLSSRRNYDEVYLGVIGDRLAERIHRPLHPPRVGSSASYAELSYVQALGISVRGVVHVGALLRTSAPRTAADNPPVQWDFKLGVEFATDERVYSVAAVGTRNATWQAPRNGYPDYASGRSRQELVAAVSQAF